MLRLTGCGPNKRKSVRQSQGDAPPVRSPSLVIKEQAEALESANAAIAELQQKLMNLSLPESAAKPGPFKVSLHRSGDSGGLKHGCFEAHIDESATDRAKAMATLQQFQEEKQRLLTGTRTKMYTPRPSLDSKTDSTIAPTALPSSKNSPTSTTPSHALQQKSDQKRSHLESPKEDALSDGGTTSATLDENDDDASHEALSRT